MKLSKNAKLGLIGAGVLVALVSVMKFGEVSNSVDTTEDVMVSQSIEDDTLELARQDVISYMEQAKYNVGASDLEYKVHIQDGDIVIQINTEQETFLYAKEYAPSQWYDIEESFTTVSYKFKESLDFKYNEDIDVTIIMGDISKDDYYFVAVNGTKLYSALDM